MHNTLRLFGCCCLFVCSLSFGQDKVDGRKKDNPVPRGKAFVLRPENTKTLSSGKSASSIKDMVQLKEKDDLRLVNEKTDKQGFHYQKYQQYSRGIPVEYSSVSVSDRQGDIKSISGEIYDIPEDLSSSPSITERAALDAALKYVGARRYKWESEEDLFKRKKDIKSTYYPKGELVYVKVYLPSGNRKKDEMALAYKFDVYADEPLSRNYIYVDAHYGTVIHKNAIIKHAEGGQAHTRFSGVRTISTTHDATLNKYVLKDDSRGQGVETYNLNNGSSYSAATNFTDSDNTWTAAEFDNVKKDNAALDAHWGAMKTYDYFNEKHGRNSYDDNGAKIKSYVHYGVDYVNAFWNGSVMTYGDGDATVNPLTSIDICAHEIGHAVCTSTADLIYMDESGAMNEGLSDIWGATIEHYADPGKSTWELGEDINFVIRSLADPNAHQQPDTYHGDFWYTGFDDGGGVHTNSGVMNHWYYILVTGKSGVNDHGISYNVQGIGFDAAASIVYRMETVYLTANSQYEDARNAAIFAATDIFGAESNEVNQTRKAWGAVGIYETLYAPSQLSANVTSPGRVSLSWKDNSPNETSFVIERSLSFNGGFEVIKTAGENVVTYVDESLPDGVYYYRVRAIIEDNSTESSNKATAMLGVTPLIMSVGDVSVCDKVFLDPGGLNNYGGDNNMVMVVNPAEAGKKIKVVFSSFALARNYWDGLTVYDGNSINAPEIGTYTETTLPPYINATSASGALTFRLRSDEDPGAFGWQAHLSCVAVPEPPSNLVAVASSGTEVNLTWQDNSSVEAAYRVERKSGNLSFEEIAVVPANTISYSDKELAGNLYSYRIVAVNNTSYSAYSNIATLTTGSPFIMSEGDHTVCGQVFLDPGGYGEYPLDKHIITTLIPAQPGSSVSVSFSELDIESFYDYLLVYDGGSVNAPLILYATGSMLSPPWVFTASNPEGKLTFEFISDEIVTAPGWRADVSCFTQPAAPSNLMAQAVSPDEVHLTWTDNAPDETEYVIEASTGSTYITIATLSANTQEYNDTDLRNNRQYSYRVRAKRNDIFSAFSNTSSVAFGTPPLFMQDGSVTACDNDFFDSGVDQDYENNASYELTIEPDVPGDKVMISFTSFDLEDGYDSLWIYDGENTEAPLVGAYTGNTLPPSATATNPDGKLTFRFFSDQLITGAGWEAHILCGAPLVAPTGLVAQTAGASQIHLTWLDNEPNETGYIIERATGNLYKVVATLGPDVQLYDDMGLQTDREYTYRVRVIRNGVTSEPSNTSSAVIGTAPIVMHNGAVTTCNNVFLDPGGDEHHGYANQTLTISPDEPGKQLKVTFSLIDIAGDPIINHLWVYNGADAGSTPMGPVTSSRKTFQASNPEGKLTFRFQSVNGIPRAGWQASVTCVTKGDPLIAFDDRTELYFDFGASYCRAEAYPGAVFSYSIVDDGTNTGELHFNGPPENNWIGLVTVKPGKVKIKASLAETTYYNAAEKIITVNIIKRTPYILFSNFETTFSDTPLTLHAEGGFGENISFAYEVVNDRSNTGEIALSGAGNKIATPIKGGMVKIKARIVENDYYNTSEKSITLTMHKQTPAISFSDREAEVDSPPFALNATAYEGADFMYDLVGGNTGAVLLSGPANETATAREIGTVNVRAFTPETSGYLSAEKIIALSITKVSQTIQFAALSDVLNNAAPFSLTASASSGLPVSYTIQSGPATVSGNTLSLTGETGIVVVEASQPGNDKYRPAESLVRNFSVTQDPVLSADDGSVGNSIHVWPNPAAETVYVRSDIHEIVKLTLIDIPGRTVVQMRPASKEHQLDISTLPQGIYMLRFETENGRSAIKRLQIVKR